MGGAQDYRAWEILSSAVMSCNIRQTDGSPMRGNSALSSLTPRPSPPPGFDHLQYGIKNWRRGRPGSEASIDQCQQNVLMLQTLWPSDREHIVLQARPTSAKK